MRRQGKYTGEGWRSGMIDFDETYSVDARDGKRIYARLIPELDVVGVYREGVLLFSMKAGDAYDWASNLSVLTVSSRATEANKDQALQAIASET